MDRPDFVRLRPEEVEKRGLTWDRHIPASRKNQGLRKGDILMLKRMSDALEPGYLYAFHYIAEQIDYHPYPLGFVLTRLYAAGKLPRAYGYIQRQGDAPLLSDGRRHYVYYYVQRSTS